MTRGRGAGREGNSPWGLGVAGGDEQLPGVAAQDEQDRWRRVKDE
jgi:hypothetical protein